MVSINVDEATLRDMRPEELYAVIMEDAKAIYTMANTDKWYYAYKIEGDTITLANACHAQIMDVVA